MDEKVIHAEDAFTKHSINDVDKFQFAVHVGVMMACMVGVTRCLKTHLPVNGLCGKITTVSAGYVLGGMLSHQLPFEKTAVRVLHELCKKEEVEDGGETVTEDESESAD